MTSTIRPANTEDMPVLAPALRLTAERENEPLAGNDWLKLPTMLAKPWPISSWFGSMRSLVFAAIALAMEMASMKPTREITSAPENSDTIMSQLNFGRSNCGSPAGMAPTTSPPPTSLSSPLLTFLMRQR